MSAGRESSGRHSSLLELESLISEAGSNASFPLRDAPSPSKRDRPQPQPPTPPPSQSRPSGRRPLPPGMMPHPDPYARPSSAAGARPASAGKRPSSAGSARPASAERQPASEELSRQLQMNAPKPPDHDFQALCDMIGAKASAKYRTPAQALLHINFNRNNLVERCEIRNFFNLFALPQEYADYFWDTLCPDAEAMEQQVLWRVLSPYILPGYADARPPSPSRYQGARSSERPAVFEEQPAAGSVSHRHSPTSIPAERPPSASGRPSSARVRPSSARGRPSSARSRPSFQAERVQDSFAVPQKSVDDLLGINIQFVKNTDALMPRDLGTISKLAEVLKRNPACPMCIDGHTDYPSCRGKPWDCPDQHKLLSKQRVEATIRELRLLGVQNELQPHWHGCCHQGGMQVLVSKARHHFGRSSVQRPSSGQLQRPSSARARAAPSTGPAGLRAARAVSSNAVAGPPVYIDSEIAERFTSMQQAFLKMDENRDGRISKDELLRKCRDWNIPAEEAEKLLWQADLNSDSLLDFSEFVNRFATYPPRANCSRAGVVGAVSMQHGGVDSKPCGGGSDVVSLASVSTRASSPHSNREGVVRPPSARSSHSDSRDGSFRRSQVFPAPRGLVPWLCLTRPPGEYNPSLDSSGVRQALSPCSRGGSSRCRQRSWAPTRGAADTLSCDDTPALDREVNADAIGGPWYNEQDPITVTVKTAEVQPLRRAWSAPGSCRRVPSRSRTPASSAIRRAASRERSAGQTRSGSSRA